MEMGHVQVAAGDDGHVQRWAKVGCEAGPGESAGGRVWAGANLSMAALGRSKRWFQEHATMPSTDGV